MAITPHPRGQMFVDRRTWKIKYNAFCVKLFNKCFRASVDCWKNKTVSRLCCYSTFDTFYNLLYIQWTHFIGILLVDTKLGWCHINDSYWRVFVYADRNQCHSTCCWPISWLVIIDIINNCVIFINLTSLLKTTFCSLWIVYDHVPFLLKLFMSETSEIFLKSLNFL